MTVAAWLLIVLGVLLVGVGTFALFKLRQTDSTVVKMMGFSVTTPVPGIAVIVIGIGSVAFGIGVLPKPGFNVVDVSLATDNNQNTVDYGNVLCPMSVQLNGHISVSGGHGTVSYRFDKSEGFNGRIDQGPVQMVSFAATGTAAVRDTEDVNIPQGTVYFQEYLTVIDPGNRQSNPVSVTVSCNPNALPAPPVPPPSVSPPPP